MTTAPQQTNTTTQLLHEAVKVHETLTSLATIEEKHRFDEKNAYESIISERRGYQSAIEHKDDRIASAREERLRVLCERYLRVFSRYMKG